MATERRGRSSEKPRQAAASPLPERKRIPLPPLPAPRRATAILAAPETGQAAPVAAPRGLSHEESDLLVLGGDPDERTGVRGVTIITELVDEIQKGLDTEISRHGGPTALATYRQTVACSLIVAPEAAGETREIDDPNDRRHA